MTMPVLKLSKTEYASTRVPPQCAETDKLPAHAPCLSRFADSAPLDYARHTASPRTAIHRISTAMRVV